MACVIKLLPASVTGFWDALINQTWQFGGISDEVYMAVGEANWMTSSGQANVNHLKQKVGRQCI
jgi:hypothetical protein